MSAAPPPTASATFTLDPSVTYPETIFDPSTCLRKGFCAVAKTKERAPAPHNLYYELHGDPNPKAKRLVFIMGLNNSSFAWHHQVKYFASIGGYQVLVHDNRGVGNSDTPKGLYKTSEMAKDVVELLEEVGWFAEGRLNVVGVSMGGMIALELASLIPTQIHSLLLTSTKSGTVFDLPSSKATYMFLRLLSGTVWSPSSAISLIVDSLYPSTWLDVIDPEDSEGRTRRVVQEEDFLRRYYINRRQTLGGRMGQMAAVLKHRVDEERLGRIGREVERVAIIVGTEDRLIHPQRSRELHEAIPGSTLKVVDGGGHALPSQIRDEYNSWIVETINREPSSA
ncbi:Alpha/Beta hydrolase protein [Leucosporidium creatinivorum]|uniref:Alpha/Beta hydrolase protein n=1 Tax=Leucosporidium creatinivorum TaxID=106004 RepID=A0A1Y2EPY4_9BASI|nr:Alpha/Beta hydrolase protein [Leucosporidium creatinivorum]